MILTEEIVKKIKYIISLLSDEEYVSIMSRDELEQKLEVTRKEIIKKHREKYSIWLASDGRWKTKVPDPTKSNGYRLVARTREKDIYEFIVDWYVGDQLPETLEELFPKWIEYKAKETSEANANKLTWVWNTYYRGAPLVKQSMRRLKVLDIKVWLLDVIKEKSLTRRKFNEMKSVLNMMLEYATELEIVPRNVSRIVGNISDKHFTAETKKEPSEQIYIGDESNTLVMTCIEQFEKTGNAAYLAICMNTALGLRVGELVALKVTDFNSFAVHIERQEVKHYEEKDGAYIRHGYRVVDYTKTPESIRDIPLTSVSRFFLKMILDLNHKRGFDSEYLLLSQKGERLHNDSVNNVLRRVNRKMDTIQKGNHSIRKTCISKMNASGLLTNEELRRFAGHKHISTTQDNYIYPIEPMETRIMNFEEAINAKNVSVTQCNLKIEELKRAESL